jgi:hypothetical protein
MNNFDQCVMAAGIGSLMAAAMLWGTGCASAPLEHDSIAAEVQPIFERSKQLAIQKFRREWGHEPVVPFMIINVTDKPRVVGDVLAAGWASGNRATIVRGYINLAVVAHEIEHILEAGNGKPKNEK